MQIKLEGITLKMKHFCTVIICLILFSQVLLAQGTAGSEDNQSTQDTITVPREEFENLKSEVANLQQQIQQLQNNQKSENASPELFGGSTIDSENADISTETSQSPYEVGGHSLALPDISFVAQAKGRVSSDKQDDSRNRVRLSEAELAVQGYVYPGVRADAFITMSPAEDEPAQVEEAYLTCIGVRQGLNLYIGKKHVSFGRTNILHCHSWLYVNQPLAIRNLVAEESVSGEGFALSYILPFKSNLHTQLDLGTWTSGEPGESTQLPDILRGQGAGFNNRFNTARLWNSYAIAENGELELGCSYAGGNSEDLATSVTGKVRLTGLDISYRRFGEANRRLLIRGENFWRREELSDTTSTATGYYLFGNYRWDKYNSIGLLYDWSEFPQATDLHESALSLIYTKQFSEQYYLRVQATRGSRPDCGNYNELLLQWVWGIGPHTHNLE